MREAWTIVKLNELREVASSMTYREAARHFNCHEFRIKNACHRYGIKMRYKRGQHNSSYGFLKPGIRNNGFIKLTSI